VDCPRWCELECEVATKNVTVVLILMLFQLGKL
jgi:hypothetical protein